MKPVRWLLVGLAAGLLAPAAVAFQETGGTGAPSASPGATSKTLGIDTGDGQKPAASGSEIRIPGLGRIGVLPKLDFGLELLYGTSGDSQRARPDERHDPASEIQLRGVIKHKF